LRQEACEVRLHSACAPALSQPARRLGGSSLLQRCQVAVVELLLWAGRRRRRDAVCPAVRSVVSLSQASTDGRPRPKAPAEGLSAALTPRGPSSSIHTALVRAAGVAPRFSLCLRGLVGGGLGRRRGAVGTSHGWCHDDENIENKWAENKHRICVSYRREGVERSHMERDVSLRDSTTKLAALRRRPIHQPRPCPPAPPPPVQGQPRRREANDTRRRRTTGAPSGGGADLRYHGDRAHRTTRRPDDQTAAHAAPVLLPVWAHPPAGRSCVRRRHIRAVAGGGATVCSCARWRRRPAQRRCALHVVPRQARQVPRDCADARGQVARATSPNLTRSSA